MGEPPFTLYRVIFIARTSLSFAADSTKYSMGSKLSYGWWKSISEFLIISNMSPPFLNASGR